MTKTSPIRTYLELSRLETFEKRLSYLELKGAVGRETFGFDRYLNQSFYRSFEWRSVRDEVLIRDNGCDLGIIHLPIMVRPIVHHMNPIEVDDLVDKEEWILNPEYLITTTHNTHNAIHYGTNNLLVPKGPRTPGDTKLW